MARDRTAIGRIRRSSSLVILSLVGGLAACAAPVASEAPSAPPSTGTNAAVIAEPTPEATSDPRCDAFKMRVLAGAIEVAWRFEQFNAAANESGSSATTAADDINNWAFNEDKWLRAHRPDARYKEFFIAHSSAITSLFNSSLSLSLLLLQPETASPADVQDVTRRLNLSLEKIREANAALDSVDCDVRPPSPALAAGSDAEPPDDPAAAYLVLATSINSEFGRLRESRPESATFRADIEALERRAAADLDRIDFPVDVTDQVSALEKAIEASVLALSYASDDLVTMWLYGGFAEGAQGHLRDQRDAAASIRQLLGLPALGEGEVL